jgi:AraC-like DNA-binding protein
LKESMVIKQCKKLAALVGKHTEEKGDGVHKTAIEQLEFLRESKIPAGICDVYEPIFGLVIQGRKKAFLGEEIYQYGAAQYIVVSVDLPLNGTVTEATPDSPYLGFKLSLNLPQLCDIMDHMQPHPSRKISSVRGVFVSQADTSLLDCAVRLTRLLDTPEDIPFLAPLIIREIYYRLMMGEQGDVIRQIATSGTNIQRIAQAIKQIRLSFQNSMRIEDLAEQANMSVASFHRHFKEITSMSPLQYQKQLRLMEARRLMFAKGTDVTTAAHQVGYESSSQFSREYSRLFGAPPLRDIGRLQTH